MKKKSFFYATVAVIGLMVLFTACSKFPDSTGDDLTTKGKNYMFNPDADNECNFTAVLTGPEIADLLHMREEEKVARDVYLYFQEKFDAAIFVNIAASEQKHMDAILILIDGYGLEDPAEGKEIGEFTEFFQPVYDNFIAMGTILVEALEVGVAIEEMDIADLNKYLLTTVTPNLVQVYKKLLSASENHLSVFQSKL